ncbi:MAG TPA: hypothetical protein VJ725_08620 [Thermoanaerobaculia bacterium]|nr:hypothetical protein [Thermoanaerobaculia bacterium]
MPFNVQLSFTGLGVVLLQSGGRRNPHPKAVDFLLLRTPDPGGHGGHGGHALVEPHLPRLWFELDDLAEPENLRFNDLRVGINGLPVVELDIKNEDFAITVEGENAGFEVQWASDPKAVEPGRDAPVDAIDWIPDIGDHFGLSSIILPGENNAKDVYTTRVTLPPGKIATQHFLLSRDGSPAGWVFTDQVSAEALTPRRVLAERVIWSRENVTSLHIDLGDELIFDGALREIRGEKKPVTVSLALTNLPETGLSGRFRDPSHFHHFETIAKGGGPGIRGIRREPPVGGGITSSGGCPPVRKEI